MTKKDLPFAAPYDQLWKKVSKIIDTFHLKNHKREECHQLYNPKQLKEAHPSFNTQAYEQTFAWLGKFHKSYCPCQRFTTTFFFIA